MRKPFEVLAEGAATPLPNHTVPMAFTKAERGFLATELSDNYLKTTGPFHLAVQGWNALTEVMEALVVGVRPFRNPALTSLRTFPRKRSRKGCETLPFWCRRLS